MNTFWLRKSILVLVLWPMAGLSLFAQEKSYSLPDLVDSAAVYFPQLLRKKALLDFSKATLTDTRNSFLPSLKINEQLNLGTDNSLAGSYLSYGVVPSTSAGVRTENNASPATSNIALLTSQYNLVDFGYRKAQLNRALTNVDLQQADLRQYHYLLELQIAKWYFILLKSQYKLKADAENTRRYESIFQVIRALAASGIRAGSDSSLALAELSRTKISFNQTMGLVADCKAQLAYLTGIGTDKMNIDTLPLDDQKIKSGLLNKPTDNSGNPIIDYYQKIKTTTLANQLVISKSFQPKIVVTGAAWARGSAIAFNDNYKSLGYGLGYQRFNYLAGISFQYDLFNGIHKRDKRNAYRFETAATDLALREQQLNLFTASQKADNAIQTIEKNLGELPVQLKAAQDTYGQKIAQYKAGIINLVDLTDAAYVLYRSMIDYTETLGDWYLAHLDKAFANGNLDSFIQAIK